MVVSPKRILWPTDFSELSLKGGRYARGLSEHFGAELHIIHVIPPVMTPDFSVVLPANLPVSAAEPELIEACRQSLAKLIAEHFGGDRSIVYDAFLGNSWLGVCEYARREQIDLIVVATHGRTGLEHALIGSTAERIVQHAPCPVLTIKSSEKDFLSE
jgi:nucleotide-binding universal stress UspA family protein